MDWNEIFKDYKKCKFDDIANYVEQEKPEYLPTLEKQVSKGTDFLTIKKSFYEKYFKKYIPVGKEKVNVMADWLEKRKKAEK